MHTAYQLRETLYEKSLCVVCVIVVQVERPSVREDSVCSDVLVKRTVWTSQSLCVVRISRGKRFYISKERVWGLGAGDPGADDLSVVLMTLVV